MGKKKRKGQWRRERKEKKSEKVKMKREWRRENANKGKGRLQIWDKR